MKILLGGAGAINSQVAWHIASSEHEFLLVDDDIVQEHNVTTGTSMYSLHHVGMHKVVALAELLWRKCHCRVEPLCKTLETSSVITQWNPDLVIDGFDNSAARAITTCLYYDGRFHDVEMRQPVRIPTVHIGVSEARTGEIVWDERYQVPVTEFRRGDVDAPCTHRLGRQILRFTASVAAGVIEHWMETGEKRDLVITERMAVLV